jgi:hypothetical protein
MQMFEIFISFWFPMTRPEMMWKLINNTLHWRDVVPRHVSVMCIHLHPDRFVYKREGSKGEWEQIFIIDVVLLHSSVDSCKYISV